MNMQLTSKMARLSTRLAAIGTRHQDLEARIAKIEGAPAPDSIALQRLKREKLRLKDEMQHYDGLLRTLSRV